MRLQSQLPINFASASTPRNVADTVDRQLASPSSSPDRVDVTTSESSETAPKGYDKRFLVGLGLTGACLLTGLAISRTGADPSGLIVIGMGLGLMMALPNS